ncbi:tyrosine-type recombinase/integrase [Bacillus sp. EB600]|uniref:tyrosine-type recombinase/integrase n=1 Tax=Bacillus sp. EB600 TaxID=2806345 RepID=UPI00210C1E62|nr:tyrosine-type recombinase/integrase [Bacillus sp. EB600]MCQ6280092.1 tyrosine-type recombinase/integrase [Bacillus sp. EB600]
MTVGLTPLTVGHFGSNMEGAKKRMKRRFIGERGLKDTPDVPQFRDVSYSFLESIDIFIRAKTAEGLRPGTIKGYHDIFRYFRQWLNNDKTNVNEITTDSIRQYINYLRTERTLYAEDPIRKREDKGLSVYTINIRYSWSKHVFSLSINEGILPTNPMKNIFQVRDDAHEEVPGIPDEQIDAIISSFDDRQFAQWRDKTLILLLLDTGLRISEALSLSADQVNFKELSIIVPSQIAKNRKSSEIPISREVAKRLRQLLDETEQYFGEGCKLFMNPYGEDFTDDAFRRRLNRLKRKLNIPKLHPHMFAFFFHSPYVELALSINFRLCTLFFLLCGGDCNESSRCPWSIKRFSMRLRAFLCAC